MAHKFIRVYHNLDIHFIRKHLLVYGDLSGSCANCQAIDIKLDSTHCSQCGVKFKYVAFRNIKNHIPKLQRLFQERPELIFVDYDDFKHNLTALKAEEFLR